MSPGISPGVSFRESPGVSPNLDNLKPKRLTETDLSFLFQLGDLVIKQPKLIEKQGINKNNQRLLESIYESQMIMINGFAIENDVIQ